MKRDKNLECMMLIEYTLLYSWYIFYLIHVLFFFCYGYVCTQFAISVYRKNLFADSNHSFRENISEARLRGPRRDRGGKREEESTIKFITLKAYLVK